MFKAKLERNRCTLVENGNFSHFRDYFVQDQLLTSQELENIESEKAERKQMRRFLDVMKRKPDRVAEKVLQIFEERDEILFSQLDDPPTDVDGGVLDELQTELGHWYSDRLSRIHPLTWNKRVELDLDRVFVDLQMEPGKKHLSSHSTGPVHKTLSTIYEVTPKKRSICFIEGPAGIGKSTLCRYIAYKWSKNGYKVFGRHFDLVVILEARCLTEDLKESIVQELFPRDFRLSPEDIYEQIRSHNSLLIIDGVDELTTGGKKVVMDLLRGRYLRSMHLLMTCRSESSVEFIEYANSHFKLKGFSYENAKDYIGNFFRGQNGKLKDKLLQRLKLDKNLRQLAENPFTTLLLCLLTQDENSEIPSNAYDVHNEVLLQLCKRYHGREKENIAKKNALGQNLSTNRMKQEHGMNLNALHKEMTRMRHGHEMILKELDIEMKQQHEKYQMEPEQDMRHMYERYIKELHHVTRDEYERYIKELHHGRNRMKDEYERYQREVDCKMNSGSRDCYSSGGRRQNDSPYFSGLGLPGESFEGSFSGVGLPSESCERYFSDEPSPDMSTIKFDREMCSMLADKEFDRTPNSIYSENISDSLYNAACCLACKS